MLFKQIQTLDSEMQTLIYENYNKFISATDTVKKVFTLKIVKLKTNFCAFSDEFSLW